MEGEVNIVSGGETYTASYVVTEDELTVGLPDGSLRTTELRGLKPEPTARQHLRAYVGTLQKNKPA